MICIRKSGAKLSQQCQWIQKKNSIFFAATSTSFLIFEDQLLPSELRGSFFLSA